MIQHDRSSAHCNGGNRLALFLLGSIESRKGSGTDLPV